MKTKFTTSKLNIIIAIAIVLAGAHGFIVDAQLDSTTVGSVFFLLCMVICFLHLTEKLWCIYGVACMVGILTIAQVIANVQNWSSVRSLAIDWSLVGYLIMSVAMFVNAWQTTKNSSLISASNHGKS